MRLRKTHSANSKASPPRKATKNFYPAHETVRAEDPAIVALDAGAYIGRPFEGGLWSFDGGRELLVAGLWNVCDYQRRASISAAGVRQGNAAWKTWRSRDGGRQWTAAAEIFAVADLTARLARGAEGLGADPTDPANPHAILNAVTARYDGADIVALHLSRDRGRTWVGPSREDVSAGLRRSQGQSSFCLRKDGAGLLFLATPCPAGRMRPCVLQIEDLAGPRWLISYLPNDPDMDRIFPSPLALPDGRILVAVTEKREESVGHTLLFVSEDGGRSWQPAGRANDVGEPAHLLRLSDGRLLLTYAVALPPYRICARLSEDNGATWGPERAIRENGGSADIGYPRSVQADDGAIVTVYQWNHPRESRPFHGGRRHIAATRWRA